MRYVVARYRSDRRDLAYRIYISDALRIISENTARFGGGSYMTERFADICGIGDGGAEETRTSQEIIDHVFGVLRKIREADDDPEGVDEI